MPPSHLLLFLFLVSPFLPFLLSFTPLEIRKALCPFPGYHGLFCPSSPTSFLSSRLLQSSPSPLPLPSGVGIALDITTGDLKFPVLSFSGGSSIWTDPSSGQQFSVPPEVHLSPLGTQSPPEVRVFKDEFELTNVWTSAIEKGTWLGGEFGEAKHLDSVFEKFFRDGTSTAVTQQITGLYTLRTDSKKLNEFAQFAVDALPKEYSPEYADFLEAWGTHVAVQTVLGGMREQQIVFKDCVFTSAFFSQGLTQAQIEAALRDEILEVHGDYAYYVARRKISLDHRFGGNPETASSGWGPTLARNPALLKITEFRPWDEFVTDPQKAAGLKKAIQWRVAFATQNRDIEYQKVKQERVQRLMAPRVAKGVAGYGTRAGQGRRFDIGGGITLQGTADCPAGLSIGESMSECNTGVKVKAWFPMSVLYPENPAPGEMEIDLALRYERDNQGRFRSVICQKNDGQCYGPWIDKGCSVSLADINGGTVDISGVLPDNKQVGMICADCDPIAWDSGSGTMFACPCPVF